MTHLTRIDLPVCDFDAALALQRDCVARVQADPTSAYLILTEHDPPVITIGRNGSDADILASPRQLAETRTQVRPCRRGGQVTWHGPGQLVAYPILSVGRKHRSVHAHVDILQQTVIDVLRTFDVNAARRDDCIGVWVGDDKIASVGVAVDRWVCYHGVAINVSNDLSAFDAIVACGEQRQAITNMTTVLAGDIRIEAVADAFAKSFCELARLSDSPLIADGGDQIA